MARPSGPISAFAPYREISANTYRTFPNFFDDIGHCIYDVDWPSVAKQPRHRRLVVEQFQGVLEDRSANAVTRLQVKTKKKGETIELVQFDVSDRFWFENPEFVGKYLADRANLVPFNSLFADMSGGKVAFTDMYCSSAEGAGNLLIKDPQGTLALAFNARQLPDKEWFDRYKIYRKECLYELLAAAWRHLAVNNLTRSDITVRDMICFLQDYFASQGLEQFSQLPRFKTLEELSRRVLAQFKNEEETAPVLVSTNPSDP